MDRSRRPKVCIGPQYKYMTITSLISLILVLYLIYLPIHLFFRMSITKNHTLIVASTGFQPCLAIHKIKENKNEYTHTP